MLAFVCAVVIACSFAASSDAAERGSSCITPNDEKAICISVYSCKVIKDGIATRNNGAIEFAKQSMCGFDPEPLVCCGSTGYSKNLTSSAINVITSFKHKFLPDSSVCGFEFGNRIVGGEGTNIFEFPWIALLRYTDQDDDAVDNGCEGSLVNERYVVTAAHCVVYMRRPLTVTSVRLGEWKISTNPDCLNRECADPVVDVGVEKIITHNLYSRRTKANDIALIRLKRNIHYTDFIRPICIPSPNILFPEIDTELYLAGWGILRNDSRFSDVKLKVKVPLVPNSTCTSKFATRGEVTKFQVCAGGVSGKDSCQGGGPLMRHVETNSPKGYQYFFEGINSWGVKCGIEGFPGVYTRVSQYANWITSKMEEF